MPDKETGERSFSERIFSNIGGKIKALAKFIFIAGIILSIVLGIMIIASFSTTTKTYYNYARGYYYTRTSTDGGMVALGIGVIVVGFLLSWVGTVVLYGFGQLVRNYSILAKRKKEAGQGTKAEETKPEQKPEIGEAKQEG